MRPTARRRRPPWGYAFLALLFASCGGEPDAAQDEAVDETEQAEAAGTDLDEQLSEAQLQIFSRDEARRSGSASDFPHDPHIEVDCAECHAAPPGHGLHLASVSCAECHAAGEAPMRPVSPAECQSCHHDPAQELSCEACHGDPVPVVTQQVLSLEVWEASRVRELSFDHQPHATVDCSSCHVASPSLEAQPCASCHEEHHIEEVDCVGCHEVAGPDAHDAEVHRTCSGSGCHREPSIEAISMTRTVCLSCHVEQIDHEPEGDCVECHQVRGESTRPHEDGWSAYRSFSGRGGS